MSRWSQFYEKRINSSYQEYFEDRYSLLLAVLSRYKSVTEEGIGIGSISKYLRKKNILTSGIDQCPDMLDLCILNNPGISVFQADIFDYKSESDIVVTHGVLEHFEDCQIRVILNKYKSNNQKSVHYVPLIGHGTPSFGDERLLEAEYWISEFNPDASFTFNDGKDLILFFN